MNLTVKKVIILFLLFPMSTLVTAGIDDIFDMIFNAINDESDSEFSILWEQISREDKNIIVQLHGRQDFNGNSLLHIACSKGRIEIVNILLSYGADINACDCHGDTPLFLSVIVNDWNMFKLLISKNADVNVQNTNGQTALHCAVNASMLKYAKSLLDRGANINKTNNKQKTAIHLASVCSSDYILPLVLGSTQLPDLDLLDIDQCTALHRATMLHKVHNVSRLLNSGADVNVRNKNGLTALHLALRPKYLTSSKSNYSPLPEQVIIAELVNHNANINTVDYNGFTPLHIAACYHTPIILNILLDHDADISAKNNIGHTVLHSAMRHGRADNVGFFLQNSKIKKFGIKLFFELISFSVTHHYNEECIKLLLSFLRRHHDINTIHANLKKICYSMEEKDFLYVKSFFSILETAL
ncbi:MAG: ankyrin repeat domain-containing protein [Candidatus Endonucleobacter bathymodioli]|uniref:Ankyrin repeat domain-containing protein n=1 Tax=Candidatus Endonucleibacter bathymodioli TaxID=539814 RepID=A0AA90NUF9_9GAMM|nr:ankyrin repeat domain-containing protein [Candidatus Endonucleobacter bathymodioli]